MFHVAVIQEYWHDFWHFFLSEPCFSQDSIFCCRFMASLWLAARHFHLFDVICCEMPHIPWRLASICYSHLYFSFSLSGSGDFFPCASNRPPILLYLFTDLSFCTNQTSLQKLRYKAQRSLQCFIHIHSLSSPASHLLLITPFSFASYLISTFLIQPFRF